MNEAERAIERLRLEREFLRHGRHARIAAWVSGFSLGLAVGAAAVAILVR